MIVKFYLVKRYSTNLSKFCGILKFSDHLSKKTIVMRQYQIVGESTSSWAYFYSERFLFYKAPLKLALQSWKTFLTTEHLK